MAQLLLTSILVATVVVPVLAAGDGDPRRGLRKALLYTAAFNVVYLGLVTLVFPRL